MDSLPACPAPTGVDDCYWDAVNMGGGGQSFYVVGGVVTDIPNAPEGWAITSVRFEADGWVAYSAPIEAAPVDPEPAPVEPVESVPVAPPVGHEPLTELPATGFDGGALVVGAVLLAAGLTVIFTQKAWAHRG